MPTSLAYPWESARLRQAGRRYDVLSGREVPPMRKNLSMTAGEFLVEGEGRFFEHLPEGIYRDPNVEVIRRMIPRKGVFYDIGANVGLVSLGLSDLAESVVAVEPGAQTYHKLK